MYLWRVVCSLSRSTLRIRIQAREEYKVLRLPLKSRSPKMIQFLFFFSSLYCQQTRKSLHNVRVRVLVRSCSFDCRFFKSSYYAILSTGPKRVQRHIIYYTAEATTVTTTMMLMNETKTFTTMALALEVEEEKKFLLQSAIAFFFILFIVHFSLPVNITVFQTITLARFGMLLQLRNHFFFLLSHSVHSFPFSFEANRNT